MADNQTDGLFWREYYAPAMERELSQQEKLLRDLFVKEYLFDRDSTLAAVRCGFHKVYAKQYGDQFMAEPYTLQKLKELQSVQPDDEKAQTAEDKQMVLNVLRQASNVGPYASRVAAAAKLAAILGMDAPTKSEQTINHRGGVMAVPAIATLDEWEKAAEGAQAKLVEDTRG
jgi:hypothetical protein